MRSLRQVQRPIDTVVPGGDTASALILADLRLPPTCDRVVRAQLVEPRPESGRKPRGIRGAGGGDLGDGGDRHGRAENVGLELHQQVVMGHAPVDAQLPELRESGVGEHGLRQVVRLVGGGLQHCPRNVSLVGRNA